LNLKPQILHDAKAVRLKGEGFKPGEWKNKTPLVEIPAAFLVDVVFRQLG